MSFGTNSHSRLFVLFVWLLAIAVGGAAVVVSAAERVVSEAWTVEQVVAALKEGREPAVAFEEATYSSLLTEPLIVRGVLRFTPPSTIEKEVLAPYRERYVIEGDRVTFESERKRVKTTISLEDYPALRSFVEAFRASFTGDVARLKQVYDTTVEGGSRQWALLLRPRDSAGRSMVESLTLSGSEGQIVTITIRSPDGDRSVMTIGRGAAK